MGGLGSGNRRQSGRLTVGQCTQITARGMTKYGLFDKPSKYTWAWSNGSDITVDTRNTNKVYFTYQVDGESRSYTVWVDMVPQHLGGFRRWFRCPNTRCDRRCDVLYLRRGYFLCRACQRLGYRTEQASKADQPYLQIEKVRKRLGWQAGYLNGHEGKPNGMHWATYHRLVAQHDRYAEALNQTIRRLIAHTYTRLQQINEEADNLLGI